MPVAGSVQTAPGCGIHSTTYWSAPYHYYKFYNMYMLYNYRKQPSPVLMASARFNGN